VDVQYLHSSYIFAGDADEQSDLGPGSFIPGKMLPVPVRQTSVDFQAGHDVVAKK
jgi:hypothetical protein